MAMRVNMGELTLTVPMFITRQFCLTFHITTSIAMMYNSFACFQNIKQADTQANFLDHLNRDQCEHLRKDSLDVRVMSIPK